MESTAVARDIKGGFKAEREFGFQLESRFPDIELSDVDTEGVALVVEISNPRRLNLYQLSRVLIGAARGGVKTAIIVMQEKKLAAAIPLFNLLLLVDTNTQLKELRRLEVAVRTGAVLQQPERDSESVQNVVGIGLRSSLLLLGERSVPLAARRVAGRQRVTRVSKQPTGCQSRTISASLRRKGASARSAVSPAKPIWPWTTVTRRRRFAAFFVPAAMGSS